MARSGPFDRLSVPSGGLLPLEGPPGTEAILICAERWRQPTLAEVAGLLESGKPLPTLPQNYWALFDRERVTLKDSSERSVGKPTGQDPLGQAEARLSQVQDRLRQRFAFVAGLAFPHR